MGAAAKAADRAGFFYVAVCDHIVIPRDKAETMSTTWFHPVATLAWVAGQTERVNLLTNVYVPAYRHPLESAKMFSTLDTLSGGRVILGVGAGHVEGEFDALGLDYQVFFPNALLFLGMHPVREMEVELSTAYNRWIVEHVLPQEPRMKAMVYLPFNTPEAAEKTVKRFLGKPGVAGFVVTSRSSPALVGVSIGMRSASQPPPRVSA